MQTVLLCDPKLFLSHRPHEKQCYEPRSVGLLFTSQVAVTETRKRDRNISRAYRKAIERRRMGRYQILTATPANLVILH